MLRLPDPYRVVVVAMAVWMAGCAPLGVNKPKAWPFSKEDVPKTPSKVVAMWTDAIRTRAEGPPQRGFGGRLTFYDAKGEKPIKVDGTLVVYAFDEAGREPGDNKPNRKFVFPNEDWDQHYSKTDLGHSYSVWIPWDQPGGPQKDISLIVRFTPHLGPTIVSDQSRRLLPGSKAIVESLPPAATSGRVALASHETPAVDGQASPSTPRAHAMRTTTIRIPPRRAGAVPTAEVSPTTAAPTAVASPPQSHCEHGEPQVQALPAAGPAADRGASLPDPGAPRFVPASQPPAAPASGSTPPGQGDRPAWTGPVWTPWTPTQTPVAGL